MKPLFVPNHQFAFHKRERPPTYEAELQPAIYHRTDAGLWFDADHPAFIAAKEKYQPKPVDEDGKELDKPVVQPRAVIPKGCGCGRR